MILQDTESEDIFSTEREESRGSHSIHSQSKCQMWQPNGLILCQCQLYPLLPNTLVPCQSVFNQYNTSQEKRVITDSQSWRFSQCSSGPTALGLWWHIMVGRCGRVKLVSSWPGNKLEETRVPRLPIKACPQWPKDLPLGPNS